MKQEVLPVSTPYLWFDGRGPSLIRWLRESDLYLPGSETGFAPPVGYIVGAEYDLPFEVEDDETIVRIGWVVFHKLNVIQFCDIDAHSFWHLDAIQENTKHSGIWEVTNSTWKAGFHDRIVDTRRHYIVEFYDDIVEVLCDKLLFGEGTFNIENVASRNPEFSYAYIRKAMALEKEGKVNEAIHHYQVYIQHETEETERAYAHRSLERLMKTDKR